MYVGTRLGLVSGIIIIAKLFSMTSPFINQQRYTSEAAWIKQVHQQYIYIFIYIFWLAIHSQLTHNIFSRFDLYFADFFFQVLYTLPEGSAVAFLIVLFRTQHSDLLKAESSLPFHAACIYSFIHSFLLVKILNLFNHWFSWCS